MRAAWGSDPGPQLPARLCMNPALCYTWRCPRPHSSPRPGSNHAEGSGNGALYGGEARSSPGGQEPAAWVEEPQPVDQSVHAGHPRPRPHVGITDELRSGDPIPGYTQTKEIRISGTICEVPQGCTAEVETPGLQASQPGSPTAPSHGWLWACSPGSPGASDRPSLDLSVGTCVVTRPLGDSLVCYSPRSSASDDYLRCPSIWEPRQTPRQPDLGRGLTLSSHQQHGGSW